MSRAVRWTVAGLVVLAVFAVITGIAGAVMLLYWRSLGAANRWVIATAAGLAVAALVTLWGHDWATSDGSSHEAANGDGRTVQVGRDNTGIISTGENAINEQDR